MPPRLFELLVGPWTGVSIYPRAASLRPLQVLGVLFLLTLLASGLIAADWYLLRQARLEDARDSQLWLMPRVTIEDGVARSEGGAGRLLDAEHFLVWIDTTTNTVEDIPLEPGEDRPVVHVGRHVLTVHALGRAPRQIAWSQVVGDEGLLSLDGPEALDWGMEYLRTMALTGMAVGLLLAVVYQLLLLAALAWFYRVLFYRGLYVPRFGTLICVGGTASIPPLILAVFAVLLGLGQGAMLTIHALGLGLLFLVGATRVRLGDERPDRVDRPESAPDEVGPALPAIGPAGEPAPEAEGDDEGSAEPPTG